MEFIERDVVSTDGLDVVQLYRDYWWWCVEGNPKRAVFYQSNERHVGSPQCNMNQALAEHIGARLGLDHNSKLIQIPLAFVPWEG